MIFPTIKTEMDLAPYLDNAPHIKRYDRGQFIVYDYNHTLPAIQWTPHMRECRGIKFSADGAILARPLHKFFNWGESPSTEPDLKGPHFIHEKLDGTMVHPLFIDGALRLATRAGLTPYGDAALKHCLPGHILLMNYLEAEGWTPIFEFTGPSNRIVVPYSQHNVTLLAARHKTSGFYMQTDLIIRLAREYMVPCVASSPYNHTNIKAVEGMTTEGIVCIFLDGERLKIKTDEYAQMHRTKDGLMWEKNVLRLVVDDKIDDLLPLMTPPDRAALLRYAEDIFSDIGFAIEELRIFVTNKRDVDAKMYADCVKLMYEYNPAKRTIAFLWRRHPEEEWNDIISNYISSRCMDQKSTADVCEQLLLTRWKYNPIGGDI